MMPSPFLLEPGCSAHDIRKEINYYKQIINKVNIKSDDSNGKITRYMPTVQIKVAKGEIKMLKYFSRVL